MAPKKKPVDAIAASRRWRRAASRRLSKMSFAEQQEYLRGKTNELFLPTRLLAKITPSNLPNADVWGARVGKELG